MSETVIRTNRLGKRYVLSGKAPTRTLAESVKETVKGMVPHGRRERREFWALRDVSLSVAEGEVVGIVGGNGAGKSTLLKILTGATEPTEGRAEVRGRVGALLEVGTGFHPELTGRDNVYLNGAILGMRRVEIARKFDEILEFSGIAPFIDVPVKRYSSGMYVRLAFSVAAHLDPEVLLVDEVLSVGDQAFQEKCLGRIHDITRAGRTVLFVSHNLPSLVRLCDRGVLLERGRVVHEGSISETVDTYLSRRPQVHHVGELTDVEREGSGAVRFRRVEALGADGSSHVTAGGPAVFRLVLSTERPIPGQHLKLSVGVNSPIGERLITLFTSWDPQSEVQRTEISDGTVVTCEVPELPLRPGKYLLTLYADSEGEVLDKIENQLEFEVSPSDYFGTGSLPSETQGPFLVRHQWRIDDSRTGNELRLVAEENR